MKAVRRLGLSTFVIAVSWMPVTLPAFAVSQQTALEECKQTVGKPNFRACMQGGGTEKVCKSKTVPKVKACVKAALGR